MFGQLTEFILPRIIGIMVHKREKLTKKEQAAQNAFMAKLDIKKRKTDKPVIVAVIGLVGSGKSSVARELAKHIGATVIEGDDIRVELRKQSERYEKSRAIAENAAIEVVKQGGNIILDSDFVDEKSARAFARRHEKQACASSSFALTATSMSWWAASSPQPTTIALTISSAARSPSGKEASNRRARP